MRRSATALTVALAAVAPMPSAAFADRAEPLPKALEGVDLVERLGATVPTDHPFTSSTGEKVALNDVLASDLPVILTFNYSDCPMLCSVQISGLVNVLNKMNWRPGKQFRIVTIGLDPKETFQRAQSTREMYLDRLNHEVDPEGWLFLTSDGNEAATRAVADATGFGYQYFEERGEYLHPAALILLSANGRVSSYQYGVNFDPEDVQAALAVAGIGGTREAAERFVLSCFHYESPTGTPRMAARVMRWVGLSFAASLAIGLVVFGYRRS